MDFQVAILVMGTWKPLHPYTDRFSSLRLSNNFSCRRKGSHRSTSISARLDDSQQPQQQLNLSVLRFTFGIPGLDESYLPRYIGVSFGSLLLLNHFAASTSLTSAQFRSEVVGLCLAAFSVSLPYIGKFLKGANPVDRTILPEGNKQIFVMPEDLSNTQKEDLAWGSYVLLRNTNTILFQFKMHYVYVGTGIYVKMHQKLTY